VHGAVLPDFDAWHQSVSALAIGPHGWLQALKFATFGALVLGTLRLRQRAQPYKRSRW
jgi:hypothetical protein